MNDPIAQWREGSDILHGEAATAEWAARALGFLVTRRDQASGAMMTLDGPLGAGKSTLARALLRAAGVTGPIPSPTYTLIEPYELAGLRFLHLDLYRLADADELALLGLDAMRAPGTISLVEWASRLPDALGPADLTVMLDHQEDSDGGTRRIAWCARD